MPRIEATSTFISNMFLNLHEEMGFMIKDTDIESKTSIDIVFVMDLTGSMGYYINQAKLYLYNIINRIMSECPAITINIGLVGYIDITEYLNGF